MSGWIVLVVIGVLLAAYLTWRAVGARGERHPDQPPPRSWRTPPPTSIPPPAGRYPAATGFKDDVATLHLARVLRDYSTGEGDMAEAHEFWTGAHAHPAECHHVLPRHGETEHGKLLRVEIGNSHALRAIWTRLEGMGSSIHHPALPRRVERTLTLLDQAVERDYPMSPAALKALADELRGKADSS